MNGPQHRLFEQPWPEGEYRFFQLGFLVEDIVGTATAWARVFGVGPFLVRASSETLATYRANLRPSHSRSRSLRQGRSRSSS